MSFGLASCCKRSNAQCVFEALHLCGKRVTIQSGRVARSSMAMKLNLITQLEAKFLRVDVDADQHVILTPVESLAEAQGVQFLCPQCFENNGGPVGTESILCYFNGRGVPPEMTPGPGRWNPAGSGLHDLTFVPPGAVSVKLNGGCNWHGFIVNGHAQSTPA